MTTPEIVILAVVVYVGLGTSLLNPTSAALTLAWIAGQIYYWWTGDSVPTEFYLYPDIFVLAVIMAKREDCNLSPYRSEWHRLACLLLERSPADRIVMMIFPVMWVIYVLPIHDYYKFWSLYYLVLAQFFAAGHEGIARYVRGADADDHDDSGRSGPLLFALLPGGGWSGRWHP